MVNNTADDKLLAKFFAWSQKLRRAIKIGFNNGKYIELANGIPGQREGCYGANIEAEWKSEFPILILQGACVGYVGHSQWNTDDVCDTTLTVPGPLGAECCEQPLCAIPNIQPVLGGLCGAPICSNRFQDPCSLY